MVVGVLRIDLRLEGCRSLKDKRRILRSLVDRSRRLSGASISEVGDQNLWGNAEIGAAVVSPSQAVAESGLARVRQIFEESGEAVVTGFRYESIHL